MKLICELSKKIICGMLAIMLTASLTVPVFADGWIPDWAIKDDKVLSTLKTADGRKSMNLFLSNFSEANFDDSYSSEPGVNLYKVDFLYKHFELNASSYPDVVINDDGKSGKTMSIPVTVFEKAAKDLLSLEPYQEYPKPSDGKGYRNGYFNVTANQANSPKKVFSIASNIKYVGRSIYFLYRADFVVYKTESIKGLFYSYTADEAKKDPSLKKIGDGSAIFIYAGGKGPLAFQLYSYDMNEIDKSELLYTEANKPVTIDVTTTAATIEESTALSETTTVPETEVITEQTTAKEKAAISNTAEHSNGSLILLSVAVIFSVIAASVLIMVIYKKKK